MQKKKTFPTKIETEKPPILADTYYKKLVEHMNEGLWMGDKDERTIYANPKFCKMMESSLEDLLGRVSYEFWDDESAKTVLDVNIKKRKKGVSSSYQGNILTATGKKVPVLLSGTPLPDGGTFGIMTDLTELKKKEENEKVLNSAIQHATDAIIIFNNKGEISSWNKGAKIIFGFRKDEMIGANIEKLFPSNDNADLFKTTDSLKNYEMTGTHKNKKNIKIAATLTPILSDNNKSPLFYLFIGRDITNQNKFEEELALKYQKIQEAYNKFGVLRRQMDYIFEILEIFDGHHDQKSIADFIVSSLIMLTRSDTCVLRIYNAKKNTLDLVSCFGLTDWKGKASIKYENSLAQKAFEQKKSLKIIDVTLEPRYQSPYLAKKNQLCSLLLIPLQFKSKFIGSISLYVRPEKKLTIFENEFIEKYAKLIEIAMGTMLIQG